MNTVMRSKMISKTTKLQLILGDITEENVDVIVNAANSKLFHGGGIAGAIVRKGGSIIQKESDQIGEVKTGHCVITGAGNLPARHVIHAVGPVWGSGNEEQLLQDAIVNSMKLASEKCFRTISLPAISSGIFGYPKDLNAKVILNSIQLFLSEIESSIRAIRVCIIDEETMLFFIKEFDSME